MESIGTNASPIEVLLVEDSPGDVRLTREAFKDAKVHIRACSHYCKDLLLISREDGDHRRAV
jgi:hypothetical protein